jgi:hypothetical protein
MSFRGTHHLTFRHWSPDPPLSFTYSDSDSNSELETAPPDPDTERSPPEIASAHSELPFPHTQPQPQSQPAVQLQAEGDIDNHSNNHGYTSADSITSAQHTTTEYIQAMSDENEDEAFYSRDSAGIEGATEEHTVPNDDNDDDPLNEMDAAISPQIAHSTSVIVENADVSAIDALNGILGQRLRWTSNPNPNPSSVTLHPPLYRPDGYRNDNNNRRFGQSLREFDDTSPILYGRYNGVPLWMYSTSTSHSASIPWLPTRPINASTYSLSGELQRSRAQRISRCNIEDNEDTPMSPIDSLLNNEMFYNSVFFKNHSDHELCYDIPGAMTKYGLTSMMNQLMVLRSREELRIKPPTALRDSELRRKRTFEERRKEEATLLNIDTSLLSSTSNCVSLQPCSFLKSGSVYTIPFALNGISPSLRFNSVDYSTLCVDGSFAFGDVELTFNGCLIDLMKNDFRYNGESNPLIEGNAFSNLLRNKLLFSGSFKKYFDQKRKKCYTKNNWKPFSLNRMGYIVSNKSKVRTCIYEGSTKITPFKPTKFPNGSIFRLVQLNDESRYDYLKLLSKWFEMPPLNQYMNTPSPPTPPHRHHKSTNMPENLLVCKDCVNLMMSNFIFMKLEIDIQDVFEVSQASKPKNKKISRRGRRTKPKSLKVYPDLIYKHRRRFDFYASRVLNRPSHHRISRAAMRADYVHDDDHMDEDEDEDSDVVYDKEPTEADNDLDIIMDDTNDLDVKLQFMDNDIGYDYELTETEAHNGDVDEDVHADDNISDSTSSGSGNDDNRPYDDNRLYQNIGNVRNRHNYRLRDRHPADIDIDGIDGIRDDNYPQLGYVRRLNDRRVRESAFGNEEGEEEEEDDDDDDDGDELEFGRGNNRHVDDDTEEDDSENAENIDEGEMESLDGDGNMFAVWPLSSERYTDSHPILDPNMSNNDEDISGHEYENAYGSVFANERSRRVSRLLFNINMAREQYRHRREPVSCQSLYQNGSNPMKMILLVSINRKSGELHIVPGNMDATLWSVEQSDGELFEDVETFSKVFNLFMNTGNRLAKGKMKYTENVKRWIKKHRSAETEQVKKLMALQMLTNPSIVNGYERRRTDYENKSKKSHSSKDRLRGSTKSGKCKKGKHSVTSKKSYGSERHDLLDDSLREQMANFAEETDTFGLDKDKVLTFQYGVHDEDENRGRMSTFAFNYE